MADVYRGKPRGLAALTARIAKLESDLANMRGAATIRNTTISGGGALKSVDFDGTGPSSPGTAGWWLGSDDAGDGELIVNSIVLRDGIIGNDALTNPVIPDFLFGTASNFSISTTLTNKLTKNATVPAGCTRLSAMAVGRVFAINSTASVDYLYGQQNIAGFNGNAMPIAATGSGGSALNTSPYAVLLTGLTPGATVSFQMAVGTNTASWAANASNIAEISALLLWFR